MALAETPCCGWRPAVMVMAAPLEFCYFVINAVVWTLADSR
jgi:hypothetical protein